MRRPLAGGGAGIAAVVSGVGRCSLRIDQRDLRAGSEREVVAERAEARWQALIKGDVEAAYGFLSAGSKKVTPLVTYKGIIKPGMWRQAKAEKVECKEELCTVQLAVTYDAKMMKGITTPIWETWIIEDGSAWYVYR